MTALERIKEIELNEPAVTASNGLPAHAKLEFTPKTVKFLLKAFKVMREIAIQKSSEQRVYGEFESVPPQNIEIDIEFEERMRNE